MFPQVPCCLLGSTLQPLSCHPKACVLPPNYLSDVSIMPLLPELHFRGDKRSQRHWFSPLNIPLESEEEGCFSSFPVGLSLTSYFLLPKVTLTSPPLTQCQEAQSILADTVSQVFSQFCVFQDMGRTPFVFTNVDIFHPNGCQGMEELSLIKHYLWLTIKIIVRKQKSLPRQNEHP